MRDAIRFKGSEPIIAVQGKPGVNPGLRSLGHRLKLSKLHGPSGQGTIFVEKFGSDDVRPDFGCNKRFLPTARCSY